MTKEQYLYTLRTLLQKNQVADIDEILSDYEAHFARKERDGYTEEETARKLGNPEDIASDFAPALPAAKKRRPLLIGRRIALLFLDVVLMLAVFVVLIAWAIALGAIAVSVIVLGFYLLAGLDSLAFIPVVPMPSRLLIGIAVVSLGVLFLCAARWFFLFTAQMGRSFGRWHSNVWYKRHELPLPTMPQVAGKKKRVWRAMLQWSLLIFAVTFVVGYIGLCIQAGSLEFWHVWHWIEE
ncbi:DUF1700 domain-containing protein [Eubacteriales bacterium OttesenSCG-928-A19]|nr:DUF1700 domain-containing protein [Eubacteriales bacterium OttesenSCG-928-A19]